MRKFAILGIAGLLAVGCGGGGSSGNENDAVINNAQASEASATQLRAKLAGPLQLHSYAGVDNAFTVPPGQPDVNLGEPGNECSVDDIYIGKDQVDAYKGPETLVSPDGKA